MFNDKKISKMIDHLILEGGLEISGIDSDTGDILYSFTPKLKEIMPELYYEHINFVNDELMALWEKGFVDIDFFSDDPLISLTKKSYNEKETSSLSKQERWSLAELKRVLDSKEL